jgi:hypothetical protein
LSLQNNEKDLIIKALEKHKGRRNRAADELGISQRTLYRKIKQYNLRRLMIPIYHRNLLLRAFKTCILLFVSSFLISCYSSQVLLCGKT